MSKEQACEYIYASTRTHVKPHENRVKSFFTDNDSNQDDLISFEDFKNFY